MSRDRTAELLEGVIERLDQLLTLGRNIMASIGPNASKAIADLTSAVASQTTVDQSAITLLQGLAQQLAAIGSSTTDSDTAAAIEAQVSAITSNLSTLSAAVTANTPAAPASGS